MLPVLYMSGLSLASFLSVCIGLHASNTLVQVRMTSYPEYHSDELVVVNSQQYIISADVRSLSLPGNYHKKITHLGDSLKNFICLKSLDLSRNVLTTLEGLEHLTYLEKLNLYFNDISSLSEVFRLHSLTALKDVDLRLNPVVKNESDYRLFVVHMLPNLRKLDDRPVRDSERKASLLHFTTDHAYKFKNSSSVLKESETGRSVHPRAKYISAMSKKCLAMDEDDEAVLNFIAKCSWDVHKPPGITGSSKRNPAVEFHDLNSIHKVEESIRRHQKSEVSHPQFVLLTKKCKNAVSENENMLKMKETDKDYRRLPDSPVLPDAHSAFSQGHEKRKIGVRVAFLGTKQQELLKRNANLKFPDDTEADEVMTTYADFTPHPVPPDVNELLNSLKTARHNQEEPDSEDQRLNGKGGIPQGTIQLADKMLCKAGPMERLLDLVDIHWNGHKSLHHNKKFLSQAETILSGIQKSVPANQKKKSTSENQQLNNLLLEKDTLQKQLVEQEEKYSAMINSLKSDLDNSKKEMDILKEQLDNLLKENAALKVQNSKVEQNAQNVDTAVTAPLQIPKHHNQALTDENASSKEHFKKMQELTEMLQESHRTLVSTNERLLKELDEARLQHKAEVEQLHWNYNQLKKTTDALSPSSVKNEK
ncbi:centrosomal protein of 72 kDa isoform X1 [Pogona vitticeps]